MHLPEEVDDIQVHNSVNSVTTDSVIMTSCDTALRQGYVLRKSYSVMK